MSKTTATFNPDYAVPPGATLLDTIEDLGMTQTELAQRMGRPLKTINEIIAGTAQIMPETALQLEKVTGIPASFWNNAESNYRERMGMSNTVLAGETGGYNGTETATLGSTSATAPATQTNAGQSTTTVLGGSAPVSTAPIRSTMGNPVSVATKRMNKPRMGY